jgi:hypothetical protein
MEHRETELLSLGRDSVPSTLGCSVPAKGLAHAHGPAVLRVTDSVPGFPLSRGVGGGGWASNLDLKMGRENGHFVCRALPGEAQVRPGVTKGLCSGNCSALMYSLPCVALSLTAWRLRCVL